MLKIMSILRQATVALCGTQTLRSQHMDPDRVWAGRTHPPPLAPDRLLGLGTDEDPGRNDLVILDEDLISKLCTAVRLLWC